MRALDQTEVVWARERSFHDALASELDVESLARRPIPDRLDIALLDLAGDVRGLAVLDGGCGQGDMTLALIERGAAVVALDISPGMINIVRERVSLANSESVPFAGVVAPLECSGLPDHSFDVIVGKYVLHHVDVRSAAAELRRLLRPGGRAIFIENAGDNPVLAFSRERLAGRFGIPRLGTADEHPLVAEDLAEFRAVFTRTTAHYPVFECLVLFDRQVLRFQYPRASRIFRALDEGVYRYCPRLRRFSYRVIVELEA